MRLAVDISRATGVTTRHAEPTLGFVTVYALEEVKELADVVYSPCGLSLRADRDARLRVAG